MTEGSIMARRDGVVAVLTIDHPPVNAMSLVARQGLIDAVRAADADPSVSAIVVTGAGSCFIAGADMREMNAPLQSPFLPDVVAEIERARKPVIAAINGAALIRRLVDEGGSLVALLVAERNNVIGAVFQDSLLEGRLVPAVEKRLLDVWGGAGPV